MRTAVLQRELKRDRPLTDPQEDQPQPPALRGPVGDLGVELLRLRTRRDRGSGLLLPTPTLEVERLAQAAGVLMDVEPHAALLLQPAPAAAQVATQAAAQAARIALPITVQDYHRRALLGAHQRRVSVRASARSKPPDLTSQRTEEAKRD